MSMTCKGKLQLPDFATSFDDWSRTCKRFDFNVELPQDQDMRTS